MLKLDPKTTALVLIDLQKGIATGQRAPYAADDVAAKGKQLAQRFRAAGAPVVLVHVGFGADFADAPLLTANREQRIDAALSSSYGFGGSCAALLFRRFDEGAA